MKGWNTFEMQTQTHRHRILAFRGWIIDWLHCDSCRTRQRCTDMYSAVGRIRNKADRSYFTFFGWTGWFHGLSLPLSPGGALFLFQSLLLGVGLVPVTVLHQALIGPVSAVGRRHSLFRLIECQRQRGEVVHALCSLSVVIVQINPFTTCRKSLRIGIIFVVEYRNSR